MTVALSQQPVEISYLKTWVITILLQETWLIHFPTFVLLPLIYILHSDQHFIYSILSSSTHLTFSYTSWIVCPVNKTAKQLSNGHQFLSSLAKPLFRLSYISCTIFMLFHSEERSSPMNHCDSLKSVVK